MNLLNVLSGVRWERRHAGRIGLRREVIISYFRWLRNCAVLLKISCDIRKVYEIAIQEEPDIYHMNNGQATISQYESFGW